MRSSPKSGADALSAGSGAYLLAPRQRGTGDRNTAWKHSGAAGAGVKAGAGHRAHARLGLDARSGRAFLR